MQLAIWTYEGPPHVGAMRIATSMRGVHLVLHAPQGDTYADLLFTMIERRDARPPVTYTTFQARDLGADTADLFKRSCRAAAERFQPEALLVAASCTAELLQDDPGGLAATLGLDIPVVPLELPSYSRKENWGAAETFLALVRRFAPAPPRGTPPREMRPAGRRVCNILGPTALGFRHRDDIVEVRLLLERMGVAVNVIAPLGAAPSDLARLPEADFNIVLYPETGQSSADWLKRSHGQPFIAIPPIGVGATRRFLAAVAEMAGVPVPAMGADLRLPWYSRSVDSTYLTGKRVFIFGDATHVVAAARIARDELGFAVAGIGTYSREFARDVRAMAAELGLEALITDDHLDVEDAIAACHPELVLGTQMERHVAKRLGIPCAVISSPVHVQDFPARRAPQMGEEGANVIFDSWVHPLMMGLEEHLLGMFRDDFEFADGALPSHLGRAGGHLSAVPAVPAGGHQAPVATFAAPAAAAVHHAPAAAVAAAVAPQFIPSPIPVQHGAAAPAATADPAAVAWSPEAEKELRKIPFFVRGKARRNTERFAVDRGLATITLETLYDAKAHYAR